MKTIKLSLTLALLISLLSCAKKKAEKLANEQHTQIENYVAKKNLLGQFTDSGLWYSVTVVGNGVQPSQSSNVKVVYSGYLLDNTPFDKSDDNGATFSLNAVIKGWQEGIPKYKEGGKGKIIIKYDTAFPGSFSKTIRVYYNGKHSPAILKIKGSVAYPKDE